jgi:hypothetical protein
LNELTADQLYLDLRTGRPTTIHRNVPESIGLRAACAALNRQRTRGIQAISRLIAPGKSISINVWTASLERNAAQWDVPLIPLSSLGIETDRDGFQHSSQLQRLKTGAEATVWLDERDIVFIKLSTSGKRALLEKKSF